MGDDSSRVEQFEQIACQIKDIAMMKDVVIIGLSQVNEKGMGKWCSAWEEKCDQSISLKTTDDSDSAIKQFDVTVEFNRQGEAGNKCRG